MTFGSLFAGIGGMDLGLERAGMTCKWQVETDPYCRRVLAKHWPDARRWNDVRYFLAGKRLRRTRDEWAVDLVAGGFPCQDISYAGRGAGLAGERSGLWYEFARVVRVLRPRFVIVENVSALLTRGLDSVLGTLAAIGYDAEWACLPAAAFGAPHIRDRVFLVAHTEDTERWPVLTPGRFRVAGGDHVGLRRRREQDDAAPGSRREAPADAPGERRRAGRPGRTVAPDQERLAEGPDPDADRGRLPQLAEPNGEQRGRLHGALGDDAVGLDHPVADGVGHGWQGVVPTGAAAGATLGSGGVPLATRVRRPSLHDGNAPRPHEPHWWSVEPDVGRVAHGVPDRVDRLRGLGNAVVPQIAEWIGRRLMEASDPYTPPVPNPPCPNVPQ